MIGLVIKFAIGYALWRIVPGMITAVGGSAKRIIDLICQILGIILMIVSVVDLIRYVIH